MAFPHLLLAFGEDFSIVSSSTIGSAFFKNPTFASFALSELSAIFVQMMQGKPM